MPRRARPQASTEFLLMGFVEKEPPSKTGFYGSGVTVDKVRNAVEALQDPLRLREPRSALLGPETQELPFSRDAKRVFEKAAAVRSLLLLCCCCCWCFMYLLHSVAAVANCSTSMHASRS